jgi:hypothetical protein
MVARRPAARNDSIRSERDRRKHADASARRIAP